MKQARQLSGAQAIRCQITERLDGWEAGQHYIIIKETYHTYNKYLSIYRRDKSEEQQAWTFHSLVLHVKIWTEF